MSTGRASAWARPRAERLGLVAGLLLAWAVSAAGASARYRCEAVYLPARTSWVRSVEIVYDGRQLRAVWIDGAPAHRFAVSGTVIHTALDNERITFDTANLSWQSDLRGLVHAQGRCERE